MSDRDAIGCGPLPSGGWHCAPWLPCTHPGGCLLAELAEPDPLGDRRQRAREAGHDAFEHPTDIVARAIDAAIETATRVKISPEVAEAFLQTPGEPDDIWEPLRAAFRAAGFEVEE